MFGFSVRWCWPSKKMLIQDLVAEKRHLLALSNFPAIYTLVVLQETGHHAVLTSFSIRTSRAFYSNGMLTEVQSRDFQPFGRFSNRFRTAFKPLSDCSQTAFQTAFQAAFQKASCLQTTNRTACFLAPYDSLPLAIHALAAN